MQWRENRKNQIHLKNPLALPASVHNFNPDAASGAWQI
jgi:hypothetical protein